MPGRRGQLADLRGIQRVGRQFADIRGQVGVRPGESQGGHQHLADLVGCGPVGQCRQRHDPGPCGGAPDRGRLRRQCRQHRLDPVGDLRRTLQIQRLQQRGELVQVPGEQQVAQFRGDARQDLFDGLLAGQRHVHRRQVDVSRDAGRTVLPSVPGSDALLRDEVTGETHRLRGVVVPGHGAGGGDAEHCTVGDERGCAIASQCLPEWGGDRGGGATVDPQAVAAAGAYRPGHPVRWRSHPGGRCRRCGRRCRRPHRR